ncbi:sodium/calcium transporter [Cenococcum geophilum]
MLSYATKEIALRAGDILGGLLNATFSSILSNLLLILSICFFFKGINRVEQHFNIIVVGTAAGLLALCVSSLIILIAFHSTLLSKFNNSFRSIIELSRRIAIILLIIYVCYLIFQLKLYTKIIGAIITLKISTALVAFYSKFIVNSISNITVSGTVSTTFISLILLLIIRNATKYIIAVIVAYKDKINLVINVTIKSILPFIIILG